MNWGFNSPNPSPGNSDPASAVRHPGVRSLVLSLGGIGVLPAVNHSQYRDSGSVTGLFCCWLHGLHRTIWTRRSGQTVSDVYRKRSLFVCSMHSARYRTLYKYLLTYLLHVDDVTIWYSRKGWTSAAVWWKNCAILATSMKFLPVIVLHLLKKIGYGVNWKNSKWPPFSRWPPSHNKFLINLLYHLYQSSYNIFLFCKPYNNIRNGRIWLSEQN